MFIKSAIFSRIVYSLLNMFIRYVLLWFKQSLQDLFIFGLFGIIGKQIKSRSRLPANLIIFECHSDEPSLVVESMFLYLYDQLATSYMFISKKNI